MGKWKKDRKKEHYYREAKKRGYRARSAFKLKQIIKKHRLLKGVDKVVELCASPGGWTQVLLEFDSTLEIVAVDLTQMAPIPGVKFIQGDITEEKTIEEIITCTGGRVDLVLADCAPKVSGNWEIDVARQLDLVERAIVFAQRVLNKSGKVLTKVFQGPGFQEFLQFIREQFASVKLLKPDASRRTSAEIYLLATGPKNRITAH